MEKQFEKASRLKLRFDGTRKGSLPVEDLWDLPLDVLNSMYQDLHKQVKDEDEVNLLEKKATKNAEVTLKMELIKHIVEVRQSEAKARKERAAKRADLDFLKTLAENKKLQELQDMPLDEINKRIAEAEKTQEEED